MLQFEDTTVSAIDIILLNVFWAISSLCLIWYVAVWLVSCLGYIQLYRHYTHRPRSPVSASLDDAPKVTVIRPVKGAEPFLYECLTSSFTKNYPSSSLTVFFCIESRADESFSILNRLLEEYPQYGARILIEDEDSSLQNGTSGGESGLQSKNLGPNPKIRNMSQAYREASGDIIWILDSNVWVGPGALGRMVDTLCGFSSKTPPAKAQPFKFVHLLPLVVGTSENTSSTASSMLPFGVRLEELFLSSSHAKFYTAINTALIAPCAVGKSTMFRRTHLNALTPKSIRAPGLDFFSDFICEDHLVGDMLWKGLVPEEAPATSSGPSASRTSANEWGKHALVFGDLAIQPLTHMSVREYVARRVRWLRVRKFTVTLATLVEPGTESLMCSLYGAYAFVTIGPNLFPHTSNYLSSTFVPFILFVILNLVAWGAMDWSVYRMLHSGRSVEVDSLTPTFARGQGMLGGERRKPWREWFVAWVARELLAFPIWFWAIWGGSSVTWRGRRFRVGMDMRVTELEAAKDSKGRIVTQKLHWQ